MTCARRITSLALLLCLVVLSASADADSFTFVVWSDTHYGYGYTYGSGRGNRDNAISDINGLAGTAYPAPFAGIVAPPALVVLCGDITQEGLLSEWQNTTPTTDDDYVSGRATLQYPSYEVMGNHDHRTSVIRAKFVEEHGNPWYSFDHGDVHFVMLDSQDGSPQDVAFFGPEQLAWLADDLAEVGTTRPVIVVMHFPPFDGEEAFDALGDTLAGHNIVAILHGHYHQTMYTVWRGWDVWGTGDVQYAEESPYSTITVVRIEGGRLQTMAYNWYLNAWYPDLYLDKPITGMTPGLPRIFLRPAHINVTTTYGVTPAASTFTVTNVGDLTLNYTITDNADWLGLSAESGSSTEESDTIQVSCDLAGLNPGLYTASIVVEDIGASNSPQTIGVSLLIKPVLGDFDADGDIDQADFGHFQACLSGPGIVQTDPKCQDARLDNDTDVDQEDSAVFQRCVSGPDVSADPNCAH